jgi:cob(I)alamin adenosyltransferase
MSIVTKTGDQGTTGLMYNRRVSKCHPRVEAYGAVDELNAMIGLARATGDDEWIRGLLLQVQKDLVTLMGELATLPEDAARYEKDGFARITPEFTLKLENAVRQIEAQNLSCNDWATPGATPAAAALDASRTICRRAERRVCALSEARELQNPEIIVYLNRLSDLLWLTARLVESRVANRSG